MSLGHVELLQYIRQLLIHEGTVFSCSEHSYCENVSFNAVHKFGMCLLLVQLTTMRKIHSCAMLAATANMPSLTSLLLQDHAVLSTPLRTRMTAKRFFD